MIFEAMRGAGAGMDGEAGRLVDDDAMRILVQNLEDKRYFFIGLHGKIRPFCEWCRRI